MERTDDIYCTAPRDHDAERKRCEQTIPGYRKLRHHPTWAEVREEFMRGLPPLDL